MNKIFMWTTIFSFLVIINVVQFIISYKQKMYIILCVEAISIILCIFFILKLIGVYKWKIG